MTFTLSIDGDEVSVTIDDIKITNDADKRIALYVIYALSELDRKERAFVHQQDNQRQNLYRLLDKINR